MGEWALCLQAAWVNCGDALQLQLIESQICVCPVSCLLRISGKSWLPMQDTLEIRDFLSDRQSHATLGRYLCEGFMFSGKMCITHPLSPESISIESKERNLPVSKHFGNAKAFSSKRGLGLCGCSTSHHKGQHLSLASQKSTWGQSDGGYLTHPFSNRETTPLRLPRAYYPGNHPLKQGILRGSRMLCIYGNILDYHI